MNIVKGYNIIGLYIYIYIYIYIYNIYGYTRLSNKQNNLEQTVIDLWFQFNDAVEGRGRECRREIIALYYKSSNV